MQATSCHTSQGSGIDPLLLRNDNLTCSTPNEQQNPPWVCNYSRPCGPNQQPPSLPPSRASSILPGIKCTAPQGYPSPVSPRGEQGRYYTFSTGYPSFYDPGLSYGQGYPQTNQLTHPLSLQEPRPANVRYPSSYGLHNPPHTPLAGTSEAGMSRRRGNLPEQTREILRIWFHKHLDHPYPSEVDKQALMARTGLTLSQVCRRYCCRFICSFENYSQISNWFINARRRQLPALRKKRTEPGCKVKCDPDQQPESLARACDEVKL